MSGRRLWRGLWKNKRSREARLEFVHQPPQQRPDDQNRNRDDCQLERVARIFLITKLSRARELENRCLKHKELGRQEQKQSVSHQHLPDGRLARRDKK